MPRSSYHAPDKRRRAKPRRSRYAAQQRTALTPKTAPLPRRSTPAASAAAPTSPTPKYSHIPRDLLRIGIITGVLVVLLVVLSIFL